MIVKQYSQISAFLKENLAFLEQNEAANNLMIGIPMGLQRKENVVPYPVLLAVLDGKTPVLTCLQTPPKNLILVADEVHETAAIEALIPFLLEQNIQVPGVIARKFLANNFAEQWTKSTNQEWKVIFNQMVYRLNQLKKTPYPSGKLRLAKSEEVALMGEWMSAFLEEAMNQKDEAGARKMAATKIKDQVLYVWDQGQAVSMAAVKRPTRHGITVSYVYTPLVHRGNGYASACVAQLSALMLEQYDFCSLYTDLANPTSNKIYARMGYQAIQASRHIEFF